MNNKEFVFEKKVYLGSTNAFGNVYFAEYFYWQGEAREAFFSTAAPESLLLFKKGIKFVTIESSMRFLKETFAFDEIIIKVFAENFKITTLNLVFTFLNRRSGELIGIGKQKIGFVDSNNSVIPIPEQLKLAWKKFNE